MRVKFDVDERVTLGGRLTRNSKSVVYRRRKGVKARSRRLDIPVPGRARGGKAKLTLSITDAAGKVKRRTRTVRVPPRNFARSADRS